MYSHKCMHTNVSSSTQKSICFARIHAGEFLGFMFRDDGLFEDKEKNCEKSRIVTWEGGFAINRGYAVREIEKERDIIRGKGEAADHRQEIAIADAGISTAAL